MSDLARFDLTGKYALVIGGVGAIGSAQALGLAQCGADIAIADVKLEPFEELAKKIRALGRKTMAITVDVTKEQSAADMVSSVLKEFPRIDILVNAFGMAIRKAPEVMPVEEWRKVVDVNSCGTFICCQAVGRQMIKQKSGKIVNISSVRGSFGADGAIAYSPSKGAVDSMTRTFAFEWAKHNIYVNAIAPTVVETALTKPLLANPVTAKALVGHIPFGRLAQLEDLVGPTIFLASKASDFITGQIIFIDGGMTIGM